MTDADIDNTVNELKALGVNVTRAHYLLDPRLLERFDKEGILVWSQAPVYHRDDLLRRPASGRASSTSCATPSSPRATTRRSSRTRSPTS